MLTLSRVLFTTIAFVAIFLAPTTLFASEDCPARPAVIEEVDAAFFTYEIFPTGSEWDRERNLVFFTRGGQVISGRDNRGDMVLCPIGNRIAVKWMDYQNCPAIERVVLARRVEFIRCDYRETGRDLPAYRERWWLKPGFIVGDLADPAPAP